MQLREYAWQGAKQDMELTKFACALRDANIKDIGNNMQLLSFDPDSHFPNDDKCRSGLLVLDFYPRLFDRVTACKASFLTGVPGTGKSWWVWYAIFRLLNQDPPPAIVWHSSRRHVDNCVLFKDGKAFIGPITAFSEELEDNSTWYFADGKLPTTSMWADSASVVMVCEPIREIYKEWIKGRSIELIMPLWTWPEMEKLWELFFQDKVELSRARRNFDLWYGGVPRMVLETPSTEDDESRDGAAARRAVNSTSMEQCRVTIEGEYGVGTEASRQVVYECGDRNTFRSSGRNFATATIGHLFAQRCREQLRLFGKVELNQAQEAWLLQYLDDPVDKKFGLRSDLGPFFESLRHQFICDGGLTHIYEMYDVPCEAPSASCKAGKSDTAQLELESPLHKMALKAATAKARKEQGIGASKPLTKTLRRLQMHIFEGGSWPGDIGKFASAVSESSVPRYLRPNNNEHPVLDACIYPDTLLNLKLGIAPPLNEQALEDHLQCLPDLPFYNYDYYVSTAEAPSFKPAPLLRDKARHPRVARTHVRIVVVANLRPPLVSPSLTPKRHQSARVCALSGSLPK